MSLDQVLILNEVLHESSFVFISLIFSVAEAKSELESLRARVRAEEESNKDIISDLDEGRRTSAVKYAVKVAQFEETSLCSQFLR